MFSILQLGGSTNLIIKNINKNKKTLNKKKIK